MKTFALVMATVLSFTLIPTLVSAQNAAPVALVPAIDSIAGEWILSGAELVTIRIATNGVIFSGTYFVRDFADGATDRFATVGTFDGKELQLAIVGTSHPGYVLHREGPDTFVGHLAGIPVGKVIFNRSLPFAGQDPS